MLLFRSEEHVDRWCQTRGLARGAIFQPEQGWELAKAWYADRLAPEFRRKTVDEAEQVFARLGLVGSFWRLRP
jgi:hypothetical protein